MMGVFDAAGAARTGALDWSQPYGFVDDLRERVAAMPDAEVAGNGLLVAKHLHANENKAELMRLVDDAEQFLNTANQLCIEVLRQL